MESVTLASTQTSFRPRPFLRPHQILGNGLKAGNERMRRSFRTSLHHRTYPRLANQFGGRAIHLTNWTFVTQTKRLIRCLVFLLEALINRCSTITRAAVCPDHYAIVGRCTYLVGGFNHELMSRFSLDIIRAPVTNSLTARTSRHDQYSHKKPE